MARLSPDTPFTRHQTATLRSRFFVFRRLINLALMLALLVGLSMLSPSRAFAQEKTPTAEQVAETAILVYGSRERLEQIRRNGLENGRLTRIASDGRTEEATYQKRFTRGADSTKDKVRLDQKTPNLEYTLVYGEGKTWGLLNGSTFQPRSDTATEFLSSTWHGIDALLRYKENGSTIALLGKDKQKGIDFYTLEVTDKEKRKTRYAVSSKLYRVLWLEYEEPTSEGGTPVKYRRNFYDYKYAQNTLVPYRSVLFEDGRQTQETRIMNITYGLKLEDSLFQNPDAQATTTAKP
jgi:hypothetical protein